ncbi:N-acetyl-anhydromuramyl-L-alanine amidase AmpD [Virgibacillus halotolerans]|uniref:N-acetylmuramoyl-L-alanine amidase n=1 Tax=Virgibacillus halotolerans TaxID=1071053 RepID=UPI001960E44B|nr:N-acetylmuramoyl-L-alanine amidase [Virgibacillus halotolerans]MBM7598456.1 N-acetyl-anhydromuramyl-L-alanine amidase AmpD [Virgibacillus halotolerans]
MVNIIKPNLAFRGSLAPINKSRIDKIVQHHMAHETWNITDVHNFHKNSNGWAGIGYNYWIGFDGKIYQGRGMNVGAHVGGHNSHTIGVGYQGDFTKQQMTAAQFNSGVALNKWLMTQLPNVNSTSQIIGHNELASTACPGKNFRMADLKKAVGGKSTTTSKPSQNTSKKSTKPTSNLGLVDYMNSKKMDSSMTNRKKLAKQYGIKNYTGTASQNTTLLSKIKGGKPSGSTTSKAKANLKVDGYLGVQTIKAMQRYFGTTVDGVLSKPSSLVIKKLQKLLGVIQDGIMGKNTISAMQKRFGTVVDGKLSKPSLVIKELQRRLNKGKL